MGTTNNYKQNRHTNDEDALQRKRLVTENQTKNINGRIPLSSGLRVLASCAQHNFVLGAREHNNF